MIVVYSSLIMIEKNPVFVKHFLIEVEAFNANTLPNVLMLDDCKITTTEWLKCIYLILPANLDGIN